MPEYLAPGVYIEEIPSGSKPIQAASTSTAGMVGMTARGPVARPTLVSSQGAYARLFGGHLHPQLFTEGRDALPYAAEGFFTNGGARLYVVRIVGAAARESVLDVLAHDLAVDAAPTLAAPGSAGDTTLALADPGALAAGNTLLLADGEASETVVPTATAFAPRVRLDQGLRFAYAAGDAVTPQTLTAVAAALTAPAAARDARLTVDDSAPFTAGNTYLLAGAAGAGGELVTVATLENATTLLLAAPLRAAHPVTHGFSSLADAAGTTLAADAAASPARVLLEVADPAGIAAGGVIRLDNGTQNELAVVTGIPVVVELTEELRANHPADVPLVPAVRVMTAHARDPGAWGDALRLTVRPAALVSTVLANPEAPTASTMVLDTAFGLFPGSVVVIDGRLRREVAAVDPRSGLVTLTAAHGEPLAAGTPVVSQEFSLLVERLENGRVAESETFERLSLASEHPRYALTQVGRWDAATGRPSESGGSSLIRLEDNADAATRLLPLVVGVPQRLAGGDDDVAGVTEATYVGTAADDPAARTGIQALENEPTLSIVAVPGQVSVTVQKALVSHCERMRYRFAVLDTPEGANLQAARAHRQNFDTTHAAIYYPAVEIADRFGAAGDRRVIQPAGHILGVYARTDLTRGVHKAPANEEIRGILSLDNKLDKAAQDILNPINLNCLRDFRTENRGLRVYGARVATSDPEWRYVNVRRLLLFIEQSLDTGLQWAVFEINDKPLWDTVKQSVGNFLTTVWRSGALEGQKAEEAFFVNIGYNVTMTQEDIDQGRLIVVIGVAPVKPAEFVIVRISQKTREATA